MPFIFSLFLLAADNAYVVQQGPVVITIPSTCSAKMANAINATFPASGPLSMVVKYGCVRTFENGSPTKTNCRIAYEAKGTEAQMVALAKAVSIPPKLGTDGADKTLAYRIDNDLDGTTAPLHRTFIEDCLSVADMDVLVAMRCERVGADINCRTYPLKVGNDTTTAADAATNAEGVPTSATPFVRWATPEESP